MQTPEEIDAATRRVRAAIGAQLRANRRRAAQRRLATLSRAVIAAVSVLALLLVARTLWAH